MNTYEKEISNAFAIAEMLVEQGDIIAADELLQDLGLLNSFEIIMHVYYYLCDKYDV